MEPEPRPTPPSPPRAPLPVAAPPSGLTLARWLYVDARRTHEVHAGIRPAAREFVVKESAYGNEDPAEVLESVTRFDEDWEAPVLLASLERRLSSLGEYWKHDAAAPGWSRLPPAPIATLDLRASSGADDAGRAQFHHFAARGSRDVILVVVPVVMARGTRFLTVEAHLDFPDAEDAQLRVLHPRLPIGPWTSLLVARHKDLADRGFEKRRGAARDLGALECYQSLLRRISEGRYERRAVAGEAPIDGLYTDYLRNLTDPRIAALHARFLTGDEEARALAGGEPAIKQLIGRKRAAHPATDEQMLLTLLEASLLARDGLRAGSVRVDPEVAALVRRFAYYL